MIPTLLCIFKILMGLVATWLILVIISTYVLITDKYHSCFDNEDSMRNAWAFHPVLLMMLIFEDKFETPHSDVAMGIYNFMGSYYDFQAYLVRKLFRRKQVE